MGTKANFLGRRPTWERYQTRSRRSKRGIEGVTMGQPGSASLEEATLFKMGSPMQGEASVTLDNVYAYVSPVAVALSTIAEDGASIPWELYVGESEDPLVSHPIYDVWKRPNEFMQGDQLWVGSYICYKLFGEAIWWYPELSLPASSLPEASNDGQRRMLEPKGEIMLLDPRRVSAKVSEEGEVKWTLDTPSGDKVLDPDQLTIFKRYNPYNPIRGLSKVLAVLTEALGDRAASEWNARFFNEQNGIPSGILKPAANTALTEKQKGDILRLWRQGHGVSKRSVGMLPGGWDWIDLGVRQRDMDFKALREYSREVILANMGVPPFIAGVLDKADYANSRVQKQVYWQGTITRTLSTFQNVINYDFLPKIGYRNLQAFPQWSVVKALLEDLKEQAETARVFIEMGVPFRQVNERLDLGFDPDDMPAADVSFVASSLTPADQALVADEPEEQDEGEGEDENEDEKSLVPYSKPFPNEHAARLKNPDLFAPDSFRRTHGSGRGTVQGVKVPASIDVIWGKLKGRSGPNDPPIPQALRFPTRRWTAQQARGWIRDHGIRIVMFEEAARQALPPLIDHEGNEARRALRWRQTITLTNDLVFRFNRIIRRHFHEVFKEVLANFNSTRGWRLQHGFITKSSEYLFDLDASKRKLRSVTRPAYKATVIRGGESVLAEAGVGVAFDVADPAIVGLLTGLEGRIVGVDDTVARRIASTLREGLMASESTDKLRDRIMRESDLSLHRARTIARTETGMAFSASRYRAMQMHDIQKHSWLSARDEDVRDTHSQHRGVDGEVRVIGDPFSNGLRYPLDSEAGNPGEVINCRCVAIPIVEGRRRRSAA